MKQGRKSGKDAVRRSTAVAGIPAIRPQVAGIDLGSERHFVCAPALDGEGREVIAFGATTGAVCDVQMAESTEGGIGGNGEHGGVLDRVPRSAGSSRLQSAAGRCKTYGGGGGREIRSRTPRIANGSSDCTAWGC